MEKAWSEKQKKANINKLDHVSEGGMVRRNWECRQGPDNRGLCKFTFFILFKENEKLLKILRSRMPEKYSNQKLFMGVKNICCLLNHLLCLRRHYAK